MHRLKSVKAGGIAATRARRPPGVALSMMFLLVVALCFAAGSHAQSNPDQAKSGAYEQQMSGDRRGTQQDPLFIKGIPAEKTAQESAKEEKERAEMANDRSAMAKATAVIAHESVINTRLTIALCIVAGLQAILFVWQLLQLKDAAGEAKRAAMNAERATDAAVMSSRPFVFPRIIGKFEFIPGQDSTEQVPRLSFVLENHGKTAARMHELQCEIFLLRELPETPSYAGCSRRDTDSVIPPDTRWRDGGDALDFLSRTGSDPDAIADSQRPQEEPGPSSRFYFIGYLIYDDFFGQRTTQGFCIKTTGGWQSVRGGQAYNYTRCEPTPKTEAA